MKSEIYYKIKKQIDDKRTNALAEAELRLEQIKKEVKGFAEVDQNIGKISIAACKAILAQPNEAAETSNKLNQSLIEKMNEKICLLVTAGYPRDYLSVKYDCPECEDTGLIKGVDGDKQCNCFKQKLLENLFEESGLVKGKTAQFDKFNLSIFSEEIDKSRFSIDVSPRDMIEKIKNRCVTYIEKEFGTLGDKGLLFTGNTGTGKTFMAQSVAYELFLKGKTVAYVSAPMMFDKINEARMMFGEEEYEDYFSGLKESELLVLDDLGTETSTEAKVSNLLQLLDARANLDLISPHKTIISTNMSMSGIREKYDERIFSRILGGFIAIQFGGEDLRFITR